MAANTDYVGDDLTVPARFGGSNTADTLAKCQAVCDSDPWCSVFMFGNHPNGCTNCCWTKSTTHFNAVRTNGVTSYRKSKHILPVHAMYAVYAMYPVYAMLAVPALGFLIRFPCNCSWQ